MREGEEEKIKIQRTFADSCECLTPKLLAPLNGAPFAFSLWVTQVERVVLPEEKE